MSVLTDFFTSLANKIRSKTGNSETLTPPQMIDEIDNIYTPTQTKSVTASTSATTVTPDTGYHLSSVTINPTPSQEKSASPSTSAQTISPDSGKLLSSVSISAISPQRAAAVAATTSGLLSSSNLTGYVYFPYGWHPATNSTYGNYCTVTQAQAQACHYHTSTVSVSTRSSAVDIGQTHSYRYVNTNNVPNTNSGTFTPTSNSSAHDMGATNTYRYVNTNTVYNSGYNNGANYRLANLQFTPWAINSIRSLSTDSISLPYNSTYLCVFYKSQISGYAGLTNRKDDVVIGDIRVAMFYGTTSSSIGIYGYDKNSEGSYMIAVVQPYYNN